MTPKQPVTETDKGVEQLLEPCRNWLHMVFGIYAETETEKLARFVLQSHIALSSQPKVSQGDEEAAREWLRTVYEEVDAPVIELLLKPLSAFRAQARAEQREVDAKIAANYRPPHAKVKRNPFATDEQHEATVQSIRDEERGEKIAAEQIAAAIRDGVRDCGG